MLPSILNIADEHQLESDAKTYGKKESYFKCPFCEQDSLPKNKDKYYLSLNTEDNVFKCWFCLESGGVLQFEALLTGRPYEDVRQKYFGERRKNTHPAYKLSPDQLRAIGWQDKKRHSFEAFQKSREDVLRDWKIYEQEELTKHYALFTLIAHFPIEKERRKHYEWFMEICQQSKVENLNNRIVQQWNSKKKEKWANQGKDIARIAYISTFESGDFEFQNIFVNILFVCELLKLKCKQAEKGNAQTVSI